jgi:hypothetical protein
LKRNEDLKDRHRGAARCFILATGPSIKEQDLSLLAGEPCISVSNFVVHPEFARIRPLFHCVTQLTMPPLTEEDGLRWFKDIEARLERTTLLLSVQDFGFVEQHGLFRGKDVRWVATGSTWERALSEGLDLARPLPPVQSSPVMALQAALCLGFREIYLLGCDHDWLLHIGHTRHFYDEKQGYGNRPGFSEWTSMEDTARSYGVLWGQYGHLLRIAEARGAKIFNATAGGLLNVFPRVRFETLFTKADAR